MNGIRRCGLLGAVVVLSATGLLANPITMTTFFGEDLNTSMQALTPATPSVSLTTQQTFLGDLTGAGTQDFESFADQQQLPITINFPGAPGGITAQLSGTSDFIQSGAPGNGRFPTSGNNYVEVDGSNLTLNFLDSSNNPFGVSAFGFYATDVGDFGGSLTLTLTMMDGSTTTVDVGNAVAGGTNPQGNNLEDGSVLYFGFIDTGNTYKSISLGNNAAGVDAFGFDDFTIASSSQVNLPSPTVPEPAPLASLVGVALLALTALRRRQAA